MHVRARNREKRAKVIVKEKRSRRCMQHSLALKECLNVITLACDQATSELWVQFSYG